MKHFTPEYLTEIMSSLDDKFTNDCYTEEHGECTGLEWIISDSVIEGDDDYDFIPFVIELIVDEQYDHAYLKQDSLVLHLNDLHTKEQTIERILEFVSKCKKNWYGE